MVPDQYLETATTGRQPKKLVPGIQAPTTDRLKCGNVCDVVNSAERLICGQDQIGTAAFAQGLARLGYRSASCLGNARPVANGCLMTDADPCVYHWFSGSDFVAPHDSSIVLMAGTHQEAVDHCLIAHQIAEYLHVPVNCLADSALKERLGCVELPLPIRLEAITLTEPLRQNKQARDLILCFEFASTHLGREHRPVMSYGPQRGPQVLVACGHEAALARTLVENGCLSADTRLLQVELLRPFPEEELLRHLKDSQKVVFLTSDNPQCAELHSAMLVMAANHRDLPEVALLPFPQRPRTPQELLGGLPDSFVASRSEKICSVSTQASIQLQIGVTPGGKWGRELLVESASAIVRAVSPKVTGDSLPIKLDGEPGSTLARLSIGCSKEQSSSLDVLIYTENDLFAADPALERLNKNGSLLVQTDSREFATVLRAFSSKAKSLIQEQDIEFWWVRPADLLDPDDEFADSSRQMLCGALVRLLSKKLDLDSTRLEDAALSNFERLGAEAVRKFDYVDLDIDRDEPNGNSRVIDSTESGGAPRSEKEWLHALRAFHLTGRGAYSECEPLPGLSLWPALASKLVDDHPLARQYPLILPSPTDMAEGSEPVSLIQFLTRPPADGDLGVQHPPKDLETTVREVEKIIEQTHPQEVSEISAAILRHIAPEYGDENGDHGLRERVSRVLERCKLVGYGSETLPLLYSWAIGIRRHDSRVRFCEEVKQQLDGLKRLLQSDQLPHEADQGPNSLAATMGEEAISLIDLEKLSHNLPRVTGSETLSNDRLEVIQESLRVLQEYLDSDLRSLNFCLVSSGELPEFSRLPSTSQFVHSGDCFEAALGLTDGLLKRMSQVFRAVRVARLLISGDYRPDLHDEVFSRFEWQSCNDEEILLVPTVVVVESSDAVKIKELTVSLRRLLRSGRPVHILITQDESDLAADELSGALEDLGSIAMAHHEAFVLQSTLGQPEHLLAGLREMSGSVRPSLSLVSSHWKSQHGNWAWASDLLSHHARVAPCFLFSPDRGASWSDRIDLSGNPQLAAGQGVFNLGCGVLPAAAQEIDESATFAHAAALRPEFRDHFRVIPSCAWSDDQEPIGAYLEKFESIPPDSLPYIWIVRKGNLYRAIVTREMANACRDRYHWWRNLQELAGVNNEFASQAVEEIRQELEVRFSNETENARTKGRQEGVALAVNRIVESLLGQQKPGNHRTETGEGGHPQAEDPTPTPTKPPKAD